MKLSMYIKIIITNLILLLKFINAKDSLFSEAGQNPSKPIIRILSSEFDRTCWTLAPGLGIIVNFTLESGEILSPFEIIGKFVIDIDDKNKKYANTSCTITSTSFICKTVSPATRDGFYNFALLKDLETEKYLIYAFTSEHNQYLNNEYFRPLTESVQKSHDYADHKGSFEFEFLDPFPYEGYTTRVMFDTPVKVWVDCVAISNTVMSCEIDENILKFNKNDRETPVTYKGNYYNRCGKKEIPIEVSVKKTVFPQNEIQLTYANYSCNCCKNLPWGTQMFYEYKFIKGGYVGELIVDKIIKLEIINPVVEQEVNTSCTLLSDKLKCATRSSPEIMPQGIFYTLLNDSYEYDDYVIDFYRSEELIGINNSYVPVKQRNLVYEHDFSEGDGEIDLEFHGTILNETHQLKFNQSEIVVDCVKINDTKIHCPIKEELFPCEEGKTLYYGYYENICGNLDNYIYMYVWNSNFKSKNEGEK